MWHSSIRLGGYAEQQFWLFNIHSFTQWLLAAYIFNEVYTLNHWWQYTSTKSLMIDITECVMGENLELWKIYDRIAPNLAQYFHNFCIITEILFTNFSQSMFLIPGTKLA